MGLIQQIKDSLGNLIYPVTKTKAVYDDDNNRLDNTLDGINSSLANLNSSLTSTKQDVTALNNSLNDINSNLLRHESNYIIVLFNCNFVRFHS